MDSVMDVYKREVLDVRVDRRGQDKHKNMSPLPHMLYNKARAGTGRCSPEFTLK